MSNHHQPGGMLKFLCPGIHAERCLWHFDSGLQLVAFLRARRATGEPDAQASSAAEREPRSRRNLRDHVRLELTGLTIGSPHGVRLPRRFRRHLRLELHYAHQMRKDTQDDDEPIEPASDGDYWHGRDLDRRLAKLATGHNAPYWVAKIDVERRARPECHHHSRGRWLVGAPLLGGQHQGEREYHRA